MSATPLPTPRFFWRDPSTDLPLVGGKVYFYTGGTTSPKDVYADAAKSSTLTNPVILEADGGANIYLDGSYKVAVYRPNDTEIRTVDNVLGGSGISTGLTGERVVYTSDHEIYLADNGKILVADRPTAIMFSITGAATLGAGFMVIIQNNGAGNLTLDPSLSETIDGNPTKVLYAGESLLMTGDGVSFFTELYVQQAVSYKPQTLTPTQQEQARDNMGVVSADDMKWMSKGIGELYHVDTSKTGADIPPTDSPNFRYVLLTAGEDGVGEYNEGIVDNESVSGSFPLVIATFDIADAESPLDGNTYHLLNTERRSIRFGSAGTVENDALQNITATTGTPVIGLAGASSGAFSEGASVPASLAGSGGSYTRAPLIFNASLVARTATETRVKTLGHTAYMRIR